jgi:hypothetical protein
MILVCGAYFKIRPGFTLVTIGWRQSVRNRSLAPYAYTRTLHGADVNTQINQQDLNFSMETNNWTGFETFQTYDPEKPFLVFCLYLKRIWGFYHKYNPFKMFEEKAWIKRIRNNAKSIICQMQTEVFHISTKLFWVKNDR